MPKHEKSWRKDGKSPERRVERKDRLWELRHTGPEVFGVRELKPVCTNDPTAFPNEYPVDKFFDALYAAKELWEQALKKQKIWDGPANKIFFQTFDKPKHTIDCQDNTLLLEYPFGVKVISAEEAIYSGHWSIVSLPVWQQEGNKIYASFALAAFPNVQAKIYVGDVYNNFPTLKTEYFDLLLPDVQQAILENMKDEIPSPQELATREWSDLINVDESTSNYRRHEIDKLRGEIVDLTAPGEMYIDRQIKKEEQQSHDDRHGWGSYQGDVTYYYLVVGAKKRAQEHSFAGWYDGGKRFSIYASDAKARSKEELENVRQKLLAEKRKALKAIFQGARQDGEEKYPSDPRLQTLKPEEWRKQYNEAWTVLQTAFEQQWRVEDEERERQHASYERDRQQVIAKLMQLRGEFDEVQRRADDVYLALSSLSQPLFGDVGTDTLTALRQCVTGLEQYIAAANDMIAERLRERGEVEFAKNASKEALEKAMKGEATPAPWYLFGVDKKIFEYYGRKVGEGFGAKVAGEQKYLPGSHAVVGVHIVGGPVNRYSTEITVKGLTAFGNHFPESVGARERVDILGLVGDDPDWHVAWVEKQSNASSQYSLANAKGVAHISAYDKHGETYRAQGWDGVGGAGPSIAEIRQACRAFMQSSSTKNESPDAVQAAIGGEFGGGAFADALKRAGTKKPTGTSSTSSVVSRGDEVPPVTPSLPRAIEVEPVMEPSRVERIKHDAKMTLSFLEALVRAFPVPEMRKCSTKDDVNANEASQKLRNSKTAITIDIVNLSDDVSRTVMRFDRDRKSLQSKIDALNAQVEKMMNPVPVWVTTVRDLWASIPHVVASETAGLVTEDQRQQIITATQTSVLGAVNTLRDGKMLPLKLIIADHAGTIL